MTAGQKFMLHQSEEARRADLLKLWKSLKEQAAARGLSHDLARHNLTIRLRLRCSYY